ncbi:septation ring formation regulator EzrA [Listeria costaricensis]|uniref:septation ring formation regulator EzrA n=1 Tax=Listeria costaricensis TaxID=2026604 RepID=UPI000C06EE5D|nr:septation ring formation regulator EzrA [Listeria costaricensis]
MLYLLIGFIVIVILVIGAGYLLKKKHYNRINELEEKKIMLRERPVIDELSKVKKLKLTGQTEELFESWRASWDEIETKLFPDIEEVMLEAEMCTDRYRFSAATHAENDLEQMLVTIDQQMNQILGGLKELLTSEEKNAKESRSTKEKYTELRREILARGYRLGEVLPIIEKELDGYGEQIVAYDDLTDKGDHLEAREIIVAVKRNLEKTAKEVERIPSLLHETETVLPDEIKNLRNGYEEMVHKGYFLEQLEFDKEFERMGDQINKILTNIKLRELDAAELGQTELHTEIEHFYETLEQEVSARSFVKENRSVVEEKLRAREEISEQLAEQITEVKQTYHIGEEELAHYLKTSSAISEQAQDLAKVTELLSEAKVAYSAAQDTLKEIESKLNHAAEEQDAISEELRSLRKDELEAREDAERMHRQVVNLSRKIDRARLPGVPEEYRELALHMEDSIRKLEDRLNEKPLNMKAVSQDWRVAKEDLAHLTDKTDEMIENAELVEQVIQYANRYRLKNPELATELREAENHFYQDYQYKKALEIAVTALERIETGAFKKIEKQYAASHSED